jgi:hypothetical protein
MYITKSIRKIRPIKVIQKLELENVIISFCHNINPGMATTIVIKSVNNEDRFSCLDIYVLKLIILL